MSYLVLTGKVAHLGSWSGEFTECGLLVTDKWVVWNRKDKVLKVCKNCDRGQKRFEPRKPVMRHQKMVVG